MKVKFLTLLTIISLAACACGPIPDYRALSEVDTVPPQLLWIKTEDPYSLLIRFSETAEIIQKPVISPEIEIKEITSMENGIILSFLCEQNPGQEYLMEAAVQDKRGNSMNFVTRFYGYNPYIPDICINEFTTRGSSSHPDMVELHVKSYGNMAGVCICQGTTDNWKNLFTFPFMEIEAGDYIIVHFKPQGIEAEVNETDNKEVSGGLDSSPFAYDFWIPGGSGISGNNGVLSLYTCPRGNLLDGVLYSNRTSSSDEKYLGFGTKDVLFRAEQLYNEEGWIIAGVHIAPEDGVNSDGSTSTRSICRDNNSRDTDTAADWHIVPTSHFSFGTINCNEIYEP